MLDSPRKQLRSWRWFAGLCVGIAAGYAAGVAARPAPLHADVTETPRREVFMAGGERAEIVLREISAILKRMDARVERIESTVAGRGHDGKQK